MESGVQPQPIGLSPEDRGAIQAYTDEWVSQCLDRDWDALVERLTDEVVFLPPDEPMVIGKAAAADWPPTARRGAAGAWPRIAGTSTPPWEAESPTLRDTPVTRFESGRPLRGKRKPGSHLRLPG